MLKKIGYELLVAIIAVCCVFSLAGCKFEFKTQYNTVHIGLDEPLTIIHTTDTHLTRYTENDSEDIQKQGKKRSKRFEYNQEEKLDYVSQLSKENGYMILHTGDIMDFRTDANLEYATAFLENNDCLFVPGNHETDNADAEVSAWLATMSDKDIMNAYAEERGGIVFVGINNSQHKMNGTQLDFLKSIIAIGKPVVLFVHVPLYTYDLYEVAMDDGDSAYLMAVPEELMQSYPQNRYESQAADAITREAYDYIASQNGSIKAIISGHLHLDYETNLNGIPQYVTNLDSIRLITFD